MPKKTRPKKTHSSRIDWLALGPIPAQPGVYLFYSDLSGKEEVVYVGKSNHLKRRLAQYRTPNRGEKGLKQRQITQWAHRVTFETCTDNLSACLREADLIQQHRPKFNMIMNRFTHYSYIGLRWHQGTFQVAFCQWEKQLLLMPQFIWFGAFRSRYDTKDAYFAFIHLLGLRFRSRTHQNWNNRARKPWLVTEFKQLREEDFNKNTLKEWVAFFRGHNQLALENLLLELAQITVEQKMGHSRFRPQDIQEYFDILNQFYEEEILTLEWAIARGGITHYPVFQKERDPLFIVARERRDSKLAEP